MGLIDTHTHLDSFARRDELPSILQRAKEAGLDAMVTIGTDVDDWSLYRELATAHPGVVHYTAGLHPCSVNDDWAGRVARLEAFWQGALKPVALGEIGLDRFHLPKDPAGAARLFARQKSALAAQLALVKRLGCPVVVHSRGAFRECVDMIDTAGVDWRKVVFHCFAEGPAEMAELTRRGGWGSFTGIITYKNAEAVRSAALAQGLDRLMLETDAPYLTPMPHRGKPNEPSYLRHTAEFCAGLFATDYARLAAVTNANARTFYGISA
ncbi:MAG TPA: TatD family hydrolase [Lacunisphaera sp.]|jgi:TatD DNase family protein|nr:TatD family hydrolase [Lacunisphaera sp.]